LSSFTSALPIHSTTSLVDNRITHHRELSSLSISQAYSNSALKIFNNTFYRNQMRPFRIRLKSSTQINIKYNVWPTSRQVKQTINYAR